MTKKTNSVAKPIANTRLTSTNNKNVIEKKDTLEVDRFKKNPN
jgi:hypothetical protein